MAQERYSKVNHFEVKSVAKIFAVFGLVIGIIVLLFSAASGLVRGGIGAAVGIGIGVVLLIALTLGLFVGGAIEAFLYNVIVKLVGSVRIIINKSGTISTVDPLSYAKVCFVFTFIAFGLMAIFVSSALLATIGATSTAGIGLTAPLIAAVFIFAVLVYGFVLPIVWASIYNWLAGKIGGVTIKLNKGVIESVSVMSYVKIFSLLSIIIFIIERLIGTGVGLALGIHQGIGPIAAIASVVAVIVGAVVVNALAAAFYNIVAKKVGGVKVSLTK